MINPDWTKEFPGTITVCDTEGKILAMNDMEAEYFKNQGGLDLIGSNLFECHNPASGETIKTMMKSVKGNIYITDTKGLKELVIQSSWYQDGLFSGLVEIIIELKGEIPILVKD